MDSFIDVPTVAFYMTQDGSFHVHPMMPGVKVRLGLSLKNVREAVMAQIAAIEAGKTGKDWNAELRQFRLSWYSTGTWIDDLNKVVPALAARYLLIAVQENLCDKQDIALFYQAAVAFAVQAGLKDIRSNAPGYNVFVIHGRDDAALTALRAFIQGQGYKSLILRDLPPNGEAIIEALERVLPEADRIIALFTADDEGKLRDSRAPLKPRVRQNVLIEVGYAMIHRRRDSIIIALGGPEIPTNLDGIRRIQADEWGFQVQQELGRALPRLDQGSA